jgi:cbb3-type cytochrome c oxidase subunit III
MRRQLVYMAVPIMVAVVLLASQDAWRIPGRRESGEMLYGRMCALCHGEDGSGYAAPASPALANSNFLASADDAYLFENIARGRPGTRMSAWAQSYGGPLSDAQVRAIVGFIRRWQTEPSKAVSEAVVEGDAARGARVYTENCAGCHGETGGGLDEAPAAPNGAPSLNNPVFLETASDGFIRYSVVEGRPGTAMAAYAGVLTDQEIDDVVTLIRSWGR